MESVRDSKSEKGHDVPSDLKSDRDLKLEGDLESDRDSKSDRHIKFDRDQMKSDRKLKFDRDLDSDSNEQMVEAMQEYASTGNIRMFLFQLRQYLPTKNADGDS